MLTVTKVSVPSLCTEKGTLLVMYPTALNGSNIPILLCPHLEPQRREKAKLKDDDGWFLDSVESIVVRTGPEIESV